MKLTILVLLAMLFSGCFGYKIDPSAVDKARKLCLQQDGMKSLRRTATLYISYEVRCSNGATFHFAVKSDGSFRVMK